MEVRTWSLRPEVRMGVYGGQNRVSRRSRQGVYDGQGWAVEVRTWCLLRSGRGAYEGQNFIDGVSMKVDI